VIIGTVTFTPAIGWSTISICNIDDAAAQILGQHLFDSKLADEEEAIDVDGND